MEKIIVYVNDTAHALQTVAPMRRQSPMATGNAVHTEWIVVACAPRLTRHASKWLSHRARVQWRDKWSEKLFAEIRPVLSAPGNQIQTVIAQGSLVEMTQRLLNIHGAARVLDARLPLVGQDMLPVTPEQPICPESRWILPSAMLGMGTMMALVAE